MATWTEQEKYSSQTAVTYNENLEYNDSTYTYNGKKVTVWTEQTES